MPYKDGGSRDVSYVLNVKVGSRGKERFRRPLGPALTSHANLAPPNFLASVSTIHSARHWPHPRAAMS